MNIDIKREVITRGIEWGGKRRDDLYDNLGKIWIISIRNNNIISNNSNSNN